MTPHPNVLRVRAGMQAFNDNDPARVKEYFADDLVYTVSGRGVVSGEYRGLEALDQLVRLMRTRSGNTITLEAEVLLADDHTVMLYARVRGQRPGKVLDGYSMYLYRFNAAGQVYEGRNVPVDQAAFDEFWA